MTLRNEHRASCGEISPERRLEERLRTARLDKDWIAGGISPEIWLEDRSRDWRLVQLERNGEMEPRRERLVRESL